MKGLIRRLGVGVTVLLLFGAYVQDSVRPPVDLVIDSIQVQPARPTTDEPVTAVASVTNRGSQEAKNFSLSVAVKRGGKAIKTVSEVPVLSSLPRSASGLSVPVPIGYLEKGSYEVVMTVDPGNVIREENEKNNEASKKFRVWTPSEPQATYP